MSKSQVNASQVDIKLKDTETILTEEEQKQLEEAYRLINLYRQFHILEGGPKMLNDMFKKVSAEVVERVKHLPGGARLNAHIIMLQNDELQDDEIKKHLLPFGVDPIREYMPEYFEKYYAKDELVIKKVTNAEQRKRKGSKDQKAALNIMKMHRGGGIPETPKPSVKKEDTKSENKNAKPEVKSEAKAEIKQPDAKMKALFDRIKSFQHSPDDLEKFQNDDYFKTFMPNWVRGIKDLIREYAGDEAQELIVKFEDLAAFETAYSALKQAEGILSSEEVDKFELTSKLPKYEKYLPMFSDYGNDILEKLKAKIKSA
ncbi:MAG: hypothetical protein N4A44_01160 [Alphaproteobacteria bacterium]|nr:hypothetical protein [Alphaproteobacteria bacterium]